MGYLQDIFPKHESEQGKGFCKHEHYAKIYEEWLTRFQGTDVILVEVGTGRGGCLQVWKTYLGPKATIYGIDHKGELFYEEPQIKHFLADQRDREALMNIPIPELDVLIDDASHVSAYQINTFEVFFPRMRPGGLYMVEDTGTSYRVKEYGGGYRKPGSFIEYCKDIIDTLHINEWTELIPSKPYAQDMIAHIIPNNTLFYAVESIAFYNGMIIIKKR